MNIKPQGLPKNVRIEKRTNLIRNQMFGRSHEGVFLENNLS